MMCKVRTTCKGIYGMKLMRHDGSIMMVQVTWSSRPPCISNPRTASFLAVWDPTHSHSTFWTSLLVFDIMCFQPLAHVSDCQHASWTVFDYFWPVLTVNTCFGTASNCQYPLGLIFEPHYAFLTHLQPFSPFRTIFDLFHLYLQIYIRFWTLQLVFARFRARRYTL